MSIIKSSIGEPTENTEYWVTERQRLISAANSGDVLVNRRSHIEIYAGDGMDVGAHEDYDGVTGDSSGREVSIARTWSFYNEVYRYKGK